MGRINLPSGGEKAPYKINGDTDGFIFYNKGLMGCSDDEEKFIMCIYQNYMHAGIHTTFEIKDIKSNIISSFSIENKRQLPCAAHIKENYVYIAFKDNYRSYLVIEKRSISGNLISTKTTGLKSNVTFSDGGFFYSFVTQYDNTFVMKLNSEGNVIVSINTGRNNIDYFSLYLSDDIEVFVSRSGYIDFKSKAFTPREFYQHEDIYEYTFPMDIGGDFQKFSLSSSNGVSSYLKFSTALCGEWYLSLFEIAKTNPGREPSCDKYALHGVLAFNRHSKKIKKIMLPSANYFNPASFHAFQNIGNVGCGVILRKKKVVIFPGGYFISL